MYDFCLFIREATDVWIISILSIMNNVQASKNKLLYGCLFSYPGMEWLGHTIILLNNISI
jgi:hypothetical protein